MIDNVAAMKTLPPVIDSSISPRPPFKDRKVWLVVFGVATVLMGLVCALLVPLVFFASAMAAKSASPPPVAPNLLPVLALYLVVAFVLIWLGVGSIMTRRWARALLVICSWSCLVAGLLSLASIPLFASQIGAAMKAAQPPGQPPLSDAQRIVLMLVPLVMLGFLFVLLPLVWGLFYGGKNVKATCEARDPKTRWTDRCPLPVLAMVLWLAFGVFCMLLMPGFHSVAPFFGLLLSGPAGTVFYLLLAVIWAYAAWALYRLDRRGWWVIVVAMVLFCLSNVITYSRHDLGEIYSAMGYSPAQLKSLKGFSVLRGRTMMWSSLIFVLPFLGYLLYIRKFFLARPREIEVSAD